MKRLKELRHTHTYGTLIRYFLSYFAIFVFLLTGFFFLVRIQLSGLYSDKVDEQTDQQLDNLLEQFDNILISIDQINLSLSQNINLIMSRYANNSWAKYQAYQEICQYSIGNTYLESIVYYDKINDMVLSSGRHVEFSDDSFFIYDNGLSTTFSPGEYAANQNSSLLYLKDSAQNYLIYYPHEDSSAKHTIFFLLKKHDLQKFLNTIVSGAVSGVALLAPDNSIAVGAGNTAALLDSSIIPPHLDKNTFHPDKKNTVKLYPNLHSGFSLAVILSDQFLLEEINTAFARTYLLLLLLGLSGILLVMLAMRTTYLPLHKFTKKIVNKPNPRRGYIEQLDDAFTRASTENQLLQDKIDQYKLVMQKSILDSVVTSSSSVARSGFDNIEPFFSMEPDNYIFAVQMYADNKELPWKDIAQFFNDTLPGKDSCIVLKAEKQAAVFLLCYSGLEQNKEEVLCLLLSDIHKDKGYFCALSNGAISPLDIPSLCENAALASEHWDQEPVVTFRSIKTSLPKDTSFSYPYDKLDSLGQSLKNHSFSDARLAIQELFTVLGHSFQKKDPLPDFFVRCVLIDMLTILVNAMNQANMNFKSYSDLYFETLYFCRSCPYEEKKTEIKEHIEQLLTMLAAEFEDKNINSSEILKIARENYTSPDFSISYLADVFHVSIAYMSYLFKKEIGENFSDYVWKLRLDKAKHLLLTTDTSINDISLAVGYLNTSSFCRKFKQTTGTSPSQFRTQNPR